MIAEASTVVDYCSIYIHSGSVPHWTTSLRKMIELEGELPDCGCIAVVLDESPGFDIG